MFTNHQTSNAGNNIEQYIDTNTGVLAQHIDSYPGRFQGSFYVDYGNGLLVPRNEAPIDALRNCRNYTVNVCNSCKEQHTVWTIWFDEK